RGSGTMSRSVRGEAASDRTPGWQPHRGARSARTRRAEAMFHSVLGPSPPSRDPLPSGFLASYSRAHHLRSTANAMTREDIDALYRRESGAILATLTRRLGDLDVAEEALQEAFAAAVQQWPSAGAPDEPVAWLVQTAKHKAIDRLRRGSVYTEKLAALAEI